MSKLIKFVKENKAIVFALAVIVLSLGLLALPGFARVQLIGDGKFQYYLSGYETFFNTRYTAMAGSSTKVLSGTVGTGITVVVLLGVSFIGLIFSKKSSFVMALTGLVMLAASIMLFAMEASLAKVTMEYEGFNIAGWITYVLGALNIIAAAVVIYKTVLVMKDEIKHPSKPKGPTYNYLKK